jgi:hypothetical protein
MSQPETNITTDELLRVIEQMNLPDLEQFVDKVIAIKAHRIAPHLSLEESELLEKINHWLPVELKTRLDDLIAKRNAETISSQEQDELTVLTDKLEEAHAYRLEAVANLARLRRVTLTEVLLQLGIHFPDYV